MDQRFKDRIELNALIEKYEDAIDQLLTQSPELAPFQKEIEEKLNHAGDPRTQEGRLKRSALIFSMLRESFVKFNQSLEEYQKLVLKNLDNKR